MSSAKKFRSIQRKVLKGFKGIKMQDIRKAEQISSANASPVQTTSPPLTSNAQGPSESGSVANQSFNLFMCTNCGNETLLQTSKELTGRKVSEVNACSVIASSSMGHARLSDFCGIMGLPPPLAKSSYQQQLKNICKHIVQATEGVLLEASEKLIQITANKEPFQIQFDDSGRKIANIGVTVDGTWQKRGHSSRIGVVFVMSVRTGAILVYFIKSKACHEC